MVSKNYAHGTETKLTVTVLESISCSKGIKSRIDAHDNYILLLYKLLNSGSGYLTPK